jgi:hypothetical protein
MINRFGRIILLAAVFALLIPRIANAHPTIENTMEVVIDRQAIRIEARISMEEILLVELDPTASRDYWPTQVEAHSAYLLKHLRLSADGKPIAGKVTFFQAPDGSDNGPATLKMATYRLEYPLSAAPKEISILQDFLREYNAWSASFVVRIRQSTDDTFQMGMLTRDNRFVYDCQWPASAAATQPVTATRTRVKFGQTFRTYTVHGIGHIIGPISATRWDWPEAGFDHLLFATALVLATRKLLDLVKVVSAFTLAHTITLTLSVLNLVKLNSHIVEPMIAASIVFVAVQNVFWPRQSRGWARLVIAFGFGLFHGLGFAGKLHEAMAGMPGVGLVAALIGFSLGVEIGHQLVVLPLFGAIAALRKWLEQTSHVASPVAIAAGAGDFPLQIDDCPPRPSIDRLALITRAASVVVAICGAWYLVEALKQP